MGGGHVVPAPEPAYGLARAVTVIVLNHVERSGETHMSTNITSTREQMHRGSFADGQATSYLYSDELPVGRFADGETYPDAHRADDHVGTFAEGQSQPAAYLGEDHEGTFAGGPTRA